MSRLCDSIKVVLYADLHVTRQTRTKPITGPRIPDLLVQRREVARPAKANRRSAHRGRRRGSWQKVHIHAKAVNACRQSKSLAMLPVGFSKGTDETSGTACSGAFLKKRLQSPCLGYVPSHVLPHCPNLRAPHNKGWDNRATTIRCRQAANVLAIRTSYICVGISE